MPNRILIHPSAREYVAYRDRYDMLVGELETEGVVVRVVTPTDEQGASWGEGQSEVYDLVVHVGEVAGTILTPGTLIPLIQERLRDPEGSREPRRATLYLADGEKRVFTFGDVE